jgi:hypothetical protein
MLVQIICLKTGKVCKWWDIRGWCTSDKCPPPRLVVTTTNSDGEITVEDGEGY